MNGDSKPIAATNDGHAKRRIRVVAAIIERDGQYLITQRRASAVLPLLWEFPGGRVEEGENDQAALKREVMYRLDVRVEPGDLLSSTAHEYQEYFLDLHLYACRLLDEDVRPRMVNDVRWVKYKNFDEYIFTPADEASINKLLSEKHQI